MNISSLISNYQQKSGDEHNAVVVSSLDYLVQNYVLNLSSSFFLTLCCYNEEACDFYNNLLKKFIQMCGTASLQLVVVKAPLQHLPGSRNFNILLVDSFQAFVDTNIAAYATLNNNNEFYYIFLKIYDDLAFEHMQKIFSYCWSNQLINCSVQLKNALGEISVYTYFPFTATHCGHIEPVLINRFNGHTFESSEIFPRKLLNFYGCALRAALWNVPPYISLETDVEGTSRILGGFEGNFLLTLSKKLNFTIDVEIPPNDERRGKLVNKEWTGAMGMLHKRVVDLSMGCFRQTADRDANASSINNFYQSAHIICVPKVAYNLTPIEVLLYPFQTKTWLLILITFGLSLMVLTFLEKFAHLSMYFGRKKSRKHKPQPSYSKLNLLQISLGMPFSMNTAHFRPRLFWATWLFFVLILRGVYQSLIFHVIRTRATQHIPEDFDELAGKGYTVVLNSITHETLKDVPFLLKLKLRYLEGDLIVFENILKEPRRDVAAIGTSDFLYYYMHLEKKQGFFKILKQKVLDFHTTIYLTKHSYLIDEFQYQILRVRAAGLMDTWARWELYDDKKPLSGFGEDEMHEAKELYILIIIGTCGLTVAFIIFFLEILSKRCIRLEKIFSKL